MQNSHMSEATGPAASQHRKHLGKPEAGAGSRCGTATSMLAISWLRLG